MRPYLRTNELILFNLITDLISSIGWVQYHTHINNIGTDYYYIQFLQGITWMQIF